MALFKFGFKKKEEGLPASPSRSPLRRNEADRAGKKDENNAQIKEQTPEQALALGRLVVSEVEPVEGVETPLRESAAEETKPAPKRKKDVQIKAMSTSPMVQIIENSPTPPHTNDLVEGKVIAIEKAALYVDLTPFGTGIIYGREFMNVRDLIKKIALGDAITAKVIEGENEDGYIELSLKEARQAIVWEEAGEAITKKTVLELTVKDANKGGLILEWQGIPGFLPASQLKTEHYPRVEGGNKEKVLQELQKFVGTKLHVCILSTNAKEGKLIFSEKEQSQQEKSEIVLKYEIGQVVEGEVTGIVDFGLFVRVEDKLEGLVHISEMDWRLVEDPRTLYKVGDRVKAQIIEIKDGKISLSLKALKENPWVEAAKKYKKGDRVTGVVIKYNRHGALISIEEGVAGLAHISEFGNDKKLKETLELGKSYEVVITLFEPKEQRMTLSHKQTLKKEEEIA